MSSQLARVTGFLGLVTLVSALLVGCIEARVVPVEPAAKVQPAVLAEADGEDGQWRDLAIISLDLDPPPRLLQIGRSYDDVALLVVVDNKGHVTERKVAVSATLRSQPGDELLARRQTTVASIAPGQATIVKFAGFPSVPPRAGYVLTVTVDSVPGERNLANNTKVLPLQLILGQ